MTRPRARITVMVLGLLSLVGALWLVAQSSLLDLEKISVETGDHTSAAAVRETAALEVGEPLVFVDRGAVADRVEQLPWVRDASVSFSLPGTLVIKIRERVPVVWTRIDAETVALVDATGRVLDRRAAPPAGVPELAVEVPSVPRPGRELQRSTAVSEGLRVAATAPEALRRRTARIARDETGWVLTLDVADVVLLGPLRDLEEKWDALVAVVETLADRHVHSIDVRAPKVPAVRAEAGAPATQVPADAPAEGLN